MKISNHDIMKIQQTRPKQIGQLVGVRLQPEPLARLDAWRREQDDLPNRSEAIRRLVDKALGRETKKSR
jgi:metal-responsive CopG/Arc/MetJ family transcriptional regulator